MSQSLSKISILVPICTLIYSDNLAVVQDPQYFVKAHQKMGQGQSESYTTMRVLYYPPLPPSSEIKPGQLRCGEHVDYGSVTLLFQDPNGGLQVSDALSLSLLTVYSQSSIICTHTGKEK